MQNVSNVSVASKVAHQFAGSIDRIYRVAITADPTPRNQIAYGCYLARHGNPLLALHEFHEILSDPRIVGRPGLLTEIVGHLQQMEIQLQSDEWIDPRMPQEIVDLLRSIALDLPAGRQWRMGQTLLRIARFCGNQGWSSVEVSCLRKAICCFERSLGRNRHLRLKVH